jgi:MFS family permease
LRIRTALGNAGLGLLVRTFVSLESPNFRYYLLSTVISISGMWMQIVGLIWLMLKLTGSPAAAGLAQALLYGPLLLGGLWAGTLADRLDKRMLMLWTQVGQAIAAAALAVLALAGLLNLPAVLVVAFLLGCVKAIDTPTRQSLLGNLADRRLLPNAVALHSMATALSRTLGPAIAGIAIATGGFQLCFGLIPLTFVPLIVTLALMRKDQLVDLERIERAPGQIRAALSHAWGNPSLRLPLLYLLVIGTLALNFQVTLALLARFVFGGTATAYGTLAAVVGFGAFVGALAAAAVGRAGGWLLIGYAAAFGALIVAVAVSPNLWLAIALAGPMGAFSILFATSVSAAVQLNAAPEFRGRVVALFAVLNLGVSPLGGLLIGALAQAVGTRETVALGGLSAVLVAALGAALLWRRASSPAPVEAAPRLRDV